ncbi:hypothetical protein Tco_0216646 [Tanacetum coccineum]
MNDAMPTTYSYYKSYSYAKRLFNKKTANHNRYFNKRVNTVKKAEVNTVKALASWVWKPKHEELDHVFKSNSASKTLTRYDYVDALGRYGRKEHFILQRGRISTDGYEVSTASFILSTAYEYLVSAAAYPDLWIVVLRIGKLQGIGEFSVQTTSGKEFSNSLIAGSLLKTIWFSTHHASQLRVEFKNHLSDNEESLGEDASKQGRINDAEAEVTFIDETSNDVRNKNNKISNNN